ncbi:MAG TPA: DUF4340 domain-containing protein, partial [Myxococcota bacterium]|nr:DUF4340 domain-containing protein [Myxococcota bacterium]
GAWVLFGEIGGEARRKEAETAAQQVFALDPNSVSAIEVSTADGKSAHLTRAGSDWKIDAPVTYLADPDAVDRLLRALSKVQSIATISPAPADLGQFGLATDGRRSVKLWTGAGDPRQLFIGGPAPVGGGRYLQLASDPGKIYTISATDLSGVTPTLVELRDKRLLRASSSSVDELTVRADGNLVAHVKKGESGWQVLEPEKLPGDEEQIRRALEELALARATGFADAPDEAQTAAFAKPELDLVAHAPSGEEHLSIAKADGKTWLRREGDPVLLEINAQVPTGVPTHPFDYRLKRVLTLAGDQVHAVELAFPRTGQTHRFELKDTDWASTEPGVELKPLKVEDLVTAVESLEATSIEPAGVDRKTLGLVPPQATVRALDAKGTELGLLSLGDASPTNGLAAISSQNSDVWRVSNDLGVQVPLSQEAYLNLFVKKPDVPPPPVTVPPPAAAPPLPAKP